MLLGAVSMKSVHGRISLKNQEIVNIEKTLTVLVVDRKYIIEIRRPAGVFCGFCFVLV